MRKLNVNPRALRWLVFERDSYTCVLCSQPASDMHHVTPRSRGGRDIPENLVSICRVHHLVLHGERVQGVILTPQEARQAVIEYIQDCYAEEIERGEFPLPGG